MTLDDALKGACNGDLYERLLVWALNTRGPDYITLRIIDPANNHRADIYVTAAMLKYSDRFVNNLYDWLEQSIAIQTSSSWYSWEYGTINKLLCSCRQKLELCSQERIKRALAEYKKHVRS